MSDTKEKVVLKSLTTYESAFGLIKIWSLVVGVCLIGFSAYTVYQTNSMLENQSKSIYVLSPDGEISLALRSHEKENRYFEYESQVEKVYKLWYEFDEGSYEKNTEKALYLFGDCGKNLLNDYNEQGVYQKIVSKNMQLFAEVDSIKFDKNQSPVFGIVYGKQTIKRPGGQLLRHLDCSFNIIDFDRSHENPHGCKLENWEVINDEVIE